MLPDKADQFFAPLEAWMIKAEENVLHPKTGKRFQSIRFLNRSHEIGSDGTIMWRPPGEDIKSDEIMRFVAGGMPSLDQWPSVKS
jgi:hypothetical protein